MLIVGDVDERRMLEIVEKIEERTGRVVNYIAWTGKEFEEKARGRVPLLEEIVSTPVIMIAGDLDEFRKAVKE